MRTDGALMVIIAMALATYGVRVLGLLLASRLPQVGRAAAWLRQIPAAILASIVAPAVLTGGVAEMGAAVVTAITAALSRNLFLAMAAGVGSVWVLRQFA